MLKQALKIARKVGDIIAGSAPQRITNKKGNDIVTAVDFKAEKYIISTLRKYFPDHAVFSEEDNRLVSNAKYLWVVDPLDGTVNFTSGVPLYSVSMGLLVSGKPVLGVVHAPVMKETFFAEIKKGAFLNGKKISVSKTNHLSDAIISGGIAPHFTGLQMKQATKFLSNIVTRVRGVRIFESGALIKCYVACGRIDAHIGVKTDPFGSAASKVIIEEAGGIISDFHGNSWNLEMRTLVCSNKKLHSKVLSFL